MIVREKWMEQCSGIDFKGGLLEFWENQNPLMEVWYENGFLIDVGYVQRLDTYFVTVVKDDDWAVPVRTTAVQEEQKLFSVIREAVELAVGS